MGARDLDPILSIEYTTDPMWYKFPSLSPYNAMGNNPINFIDPDGNYAVSVHYRITYNALTKFGYNSLFSDKIAHMASVYADHPKKGALKIDNVAHNTDHNYRLNIDYNPTELSQDECNSTWHSMMSNAEQKGGMTHTEAMNRGFQFGWENIFAQKDGYDEGKLGQGLHALQDAYAHQGASTNEHLGINVSSAKMLQNDMSGNTSNADFITNSAVAVFSLLRGNSNGVGLSDGMQFNFTGMSKKQLSQTSGLFRSAGYQLYSTNKKGVYIINKLEQ
jgi:hypothetical protein